MIGMLDTGLVQAHVAESGHFAEDGVLAAPGLVAVVRGLNPAAGRVGHVGIALPDQHQPRWIGIGKRLQDHRVDHAENGGVGSYAQRQNRDAGQGVPRAPQDGPECVPQGLGVRAYLVSPHRSIRICQAQTVLKMEAGWAELTKDLLSYRHESRYFHCFLLFLDVRDSARRRPRMRKVARI